MAIQRLSNHEILAEFRIPPQNTRSGCILFEQRRAKDLGMARPDRRLDYGSRHIPRSTFPTTV